MRPFRFFFGLSIAIILFFFVAKIFVYAFIIAAILSIAYAIIRRIRDFITYDRDGEYYIPAYDRPGIFNTVRDFRDRKEAEPLFYEDTFRRTNPVNNIHFVDIK
jgi:hypothetical protein